MTDHLADLEARDRKLRPRRRGAVDPPPDGETRQKKSRTGGPKSKSEISLQWHVAALLENNLPDDVFYTAFPAGGGGHMRGMMLKGMGLKAGVPDILIVWQGRVYWIELKRADGGALSDAQKETQPILTAAGCPVANCQTLDQVKGQLQAWGIPRRATTKQAESFVGIGKSLHLALANEEWKL
jgi:hypothetical protein